MLNAVAWPEPEPQVIPGTVVDEAARGRALMRQAEPGALTLKVGRDALRTLCAQCQACLGDLDGVDEAIPDLAPVW